MEAEERGRWKGQRDELLRSWSAQITLSLACSDLDHRGPWVDVLAKRSGRSAAVALVNASAAAPPPPTPPPRPHATQCEGLPGGQWEGLKATR